MCPGVRVCAIVNRDHTNYNNIMILRTVPWNKIGFRKTSDIYVYGYYTALVHAFIGT